MYDNDVPNLVDEIEQLFDRHGQVLYDGLRREPVTALDHALQCAQLAEWANAEPTLVAAAFLHDVGHFLLPQDDDRVDDAHEVRAVPWLARGFGVAVTEPVRLHVMAKRYLVRTDAAYAEALSDASRHSLALQGGPMGEGELAAFEQMPFAMQAVRLRRWDDAAKEPGRRTPPLGYYLALLRELRQPVFADSTIGLGVLSAA